MLAAVFVLALVEVRAGRLEKAFKALEVHDYFKARELFRKEAGKHPSACWYGLSVISGRANNPFYDLDSAYQYILRADLAFTEAPDRERVRIGALGVSHTSILAQREHVLERAWEMVRGQNTVIAYRSYLQRYPSGPRAMEARNIMHHLAFSAARERNTAASYREFIEAYPEAREAFEARSRLQDAVYEEATVRRDMASYRAFIVDHPENPNVRKAEDEVYRLSTPGRTIAEYHAFIKAEPANHRVADAWRSLYEAYTRDLNAGTITRFIAEYPEYPFMEELVDDYRSATLELLPFRRDGRWGFIDGDGTERIKAEYDWVEPFLSGQALVGRGDRTGTINRSGRLVIPIEYDEVDEFAEGTAVVERSGRVGAVDRSGEMVIPMVYTELGELSEGLAFVEDHGQMGYVNARGEMVISPAYGTASTFRNGRAVVGGQGLSGVIDRTGQLVLPVEYDWVEGFEQGVSRVRRNGRFGLVSRTGAVLLEPVYDHIGMFHDGLALLVDGLQCGYVDTTGSLVIAKDYEAAPDVATWGDFACGRAEVQLNGKRGLIGTRNERVVPCQYADVGGGRGPLFPVRKRLKWGFVDGAGNTVVEPRYDQVWDLSHGLARVRSGELFGAIDTTGREVIAVQHAALNDAQYGHVVGGGARLGVFDRTGRQVIPPEHERITLVTDKVAKVENGERFAYRSLVDGHYIWKEEGFSVGSPQ